MGRKAKKVTTEAGVVNAAEEILAPDPLPKVGDQVNYIWPNTGTVNPAKVTAVYTALESRVVDLDVDTGAGLKPVKSAPWRDEDDHAGNTWHWPAE